MPRVTITLPDKSPQPYRFDLKREIVTIGRGQDNDIVAGCGSVSGKHSEMHRVKGGYQLIDVGSTNGIKIDGIRHQTVVLHTGMVVKLGDVEFGFSLSEEELDVLALESEPTKPVIKEEDTDEEDTDEEDIDEVVIPEKPIAKEVEKVEINDDLDKLPELPPVRLNKRKEKEAELAEQEKKAKQEERAKKEERARKEDRADKEEKSEKRERSERPARPERDEYSESKAVTIGSGFILLVLIAAAGAFFYGASTRHEKDTGENLLKGIVNKEDVKEDAPTDVEDKPDGGSE
ncbi:MAG: FHA domain-containing protein [Verrucomicrobiota bacterium]